MLSNLGSAYTALGEARRALTYHEQHLAVARALGDRHGEGVALGDLGLAYAALKRNAHKPAPATSNTWRSRQDR